MLLARQNLQMILTSGAELKSLPTWFYSFLENKEIANASLV